MRVHLRSISSAWFTLHDEDGVDIAPELYGIRYEHMVGKQYRLELMLHPHTSDVKTNVVGFVTHVILGKRRYKLIPDGKVDDANK